MVNVRHILIEPEAAEDGTISDEAWAAAEQTANDILDQWLAGDATEESFANMANENSSDPGSNTNGGLGAGTGIFNGDIGVIVQIDYEAELVTVDFDDKRAEYAFDLLGELEPAYAMTIHKSQGSEYRAVILSAFAGSPYLLTRSVLYTAITRARELLIVVGDEEMLAAMVRNDRRQKRYSGLKLRLEEGTA